MKVVCFVSLLLTLLSCSRNKGGEILTIRLSKSDYEDIITVMGMVQAVVNHPVNPPGEMFSQMTVMHLAADGSHVKKGDTICILSAPELDLTYHQGINSLDSLIAGKKKAEADNKLNIALLESQLATSEAQLQISSLDSLKLRYATEVQRKLLELEMQKALIEKEKTEKKLKAGRSIAETDIKQMNARIIQEKARVKSLEDKVKGLIIIADREGVVSRTVSPRFMFMGPQGLGTIGGPVREGSVVFLDFPLLQFPELDKMQISAEVAEADFKKIDKGQTARITVDAAEKLETTGRVNRKNLIGSRDQLYSESKVKFYEVIIDIDSCHLKMKPGLSATCEITLEQAKDTLFVPTLSIFEKDSMKIVYVKGPRKFIPVRVRTGMSGNSYTIVTSGLKGDEIIALSEPPGSLVDSSPLKEEKPDSTRIHHPE